MAGVILWLIYGKTEAKGHAAEEAPVTVAPHVEEPAPTPLLTSTEPVPPAGSNTHETTVSEEAPHEETAPVPEPVVQQSVDYPAPASVPPPLPAPTTALGKESGSTAVKKYASVDDGIYRGKVVRCDGAESGGPWVGWSNAGTLCLDVGENFIRVKFDGQVWVTEARGTRRWKPTQLEVNDVVRATINDGTMIRAELLTNVRD